MCKRLLTAVVLSLVVAVSLTSCAREEEPVSDGMMPPPPEAPQGEMAPEPPGEAVEEPAEEPGGEAAGAAEEMDADAVVEQVGAPVFEGATAGSVAAEEGKTVAVFTTPAAYKDVKEFYLAELTAPDWTNNGFEMGAMGGDEWEFKSADETKLVMVKRDSGASETEIRFTLKSAP